MTPEEFLTKLGEAKPGEEVVYHVGILGDAGHNTKMAAREALAAFGRGEVELTQRRIRSAKRSDGVGSFSYAAVKRANIRPRERFEMPPLPLPSHLRVR